MSDHKGMCVRTCVRVHRRVGVRMIMVRHTHDVNLPMSDHKGMWQLSWPMEEEAARQLCRCPSRLRAAAMDICRGWYGTYDWGKPARAQAALHLLAHLSRSPRWHEEVIYTVAPL